jgi:hypothetical protein
MEKGTPSIHSRKSRSSRKSQTYNVELVYHSDCENVKIQTGEDKSELEHKNLFLDGVDMTSSVGDPDSSSQEQA